MCYYISADNARSHQRTSPMHKKAAANRCGQGLPENLRTNALRKSLGFCPLKGIHSKGDPRAVKAQGFAIRAALEREGRKAVLTGFGKGKPSSERFPFPPPELPLFLPGTLDVVESLFGGVPARRGTRLCLPACLKAHAAFPLSD